MSLKALSDYTFYSRYSQHNSDLKRRETWAESVSRVFNMHRKKYAVQIANFPELADEIAFAEKQVLKKHCLGSQRALQYGGDDTLRRNERIYNCCGLHISKPKAFQDVVWLLLAGAGVGFSIQKHHVSKLPKLVKRTGKSETYKIPDTCEGWADAVGILLSSYFTNGGYFPEWQGKRVKFDGSEIRPKGSLIAGKFKAPGPEPLLNGIEKVEKILEVAGAENRKLRPIEVYDIIMHCADFVISAGLRRSATIALFSKDDQEMVEAKTGNWWITNPQRGRSNNSVVLKRDEITKDEFDAIFKSVKEFGEPGFVFVTDYNQLVNPCAEISWIIEENQSKKSTVGFCNLSEINGRYCSSYENFSQAARAATIIGTLQAGYTDFPYIGENTEKFVREESLLGVSITGWMDNPDILFDEKILKTVAREVVETNKRIAKMLGINPAARLCTAKPSGHTSCILGTASGIHPHHAKRYIRRVQSNKQEWALNVFASQNPAAVQDSLWSANKTDSIVSFLCEVPPGAILKNKISSIELLEKVKIAQQNWVIAGVNATRNTHKDLSHSVSNTITVREHEWDETRDYIFKNRRYFTGISLLDVKGDLDYKQAPLSTILSAQEIHAEYGDACLFASGLIVDGQHAFDNDLWQACSVALMGFEECFEKETPLKIDWIRRINQFANRYFNGNVKKTTYCLKHVSLLKTWIDLEREYKDVDWSIAYEEKRELTDVGDNAAVACQGGKCEIT